MISNNFPKSEICQVLFANILCGIKVEGLFCDKYGQFYFMMLQSYCVNDVLTQMLFCSFLLHNVCVLGSVPVTSDCFLITGILLVFVFSVTYCIS